MCARNEEHQVLYEKYRYFTSIDKLAVLYYYVVVLPCIYLFIQVDLVSGYVTICCKHTHTHSQRLCPLELGLSRFLLLFLSVFLLGHFDLVCGRIVTCGFFSMSSSWKSCEELKCFK